MNQCNPYSLSHMRALIRNTPSSEKQNLQAVLVLHLEGVFPADVVIDRQHGDVKAGQQDTSQDAVFFLICSKEIGSHESNML